MEQRTIPTRKLRDAERSRRTILDAAEALFSARGFHGVGLREIAAASGLSRQMPGYLFESKESLYRAVIERVSAERQQATSNALLPVHQWCAGRESVAGLEAALAQSMESYMGFFLARPAFARLITWEELAGAQRLRAAHRRATALTDAFQAVRKVAKQRRLRRFSVDEAVLLWIAFGYTPIANQATLRVAMERDVSDPKTRKKHVAFAVEQMLFLLAGCNS
jgi:AcrR family transcriptional regulator